MNLLNALGISKGSTPNKYRPRPTEFVIIDRMVGRLLGQPCGVAWVDHNQKFLTFPSRHAARQYARGSSFVTIKPIGSLRAREAIAALGVLA